MSVTKKHLFFCCQSSCVCLVNHASTPCWGCLIYVSFPCMLLISRNMSAKTCSNMFKPCLTKVWWLSDHFSRFPQRFLAQKLVFFLLKTKSSKSLTVSLHVVLPYPFHSFCFKSPKSPKFARECHFSPTFVCPFSEPPVTAGHRTPLPRFAGSHGSIVVPHGPSAVGDLQGQIRDGFLQAASQRLGGDPWVNQSGKL